MFCSFSSKLQTERTTVSIISCSICVFGCVLGVGGWGGGGRCSACKSSASTGAITLREAEKSITPCNLAERAHTHKHTHTSLSHTHTHTHTHTSLFLSLSHT